MTGRGPGRVGGFQLLHSFHSRGRAGGNSPRLLLFTAVTVTTVTEITSAQRPKQYPQAMRLAAKFGENPKPPTHPSGCGCCRKAPYENGKTRNTRRANAPTYITAVTVTRITGKTYPLFSAGELLFQPGATVALSAPPLYRKNSSAQDRSRASG